MNKIIILLTLLVITLVSCDKNEFDTNAPAEKNKQIILTFATQEDFDKTLEKVNAMSHQERIVWEKEQGFKSFGTICDDFYETIQPESFKNIDDVKAFVAKNSDKIELHTRPDGEIYCVTKQFMNNKRYLANLDEEYKIGSHIVKLNEITNSLTGSIKKASSSIVRSDEIIAQNKIGSDNYRMHIWIDTYNYYNGSNYTTYVKNELKLSNFARWLAIWWERTYSTEFRITLKTEDEAYGVLTGGNGSNTVKADIKSEYLINGAFPIGGGNINTNPHLVSYSIYAKNSKGCLVDESKIY